MRVPQSKPEGETFAALQDARFYGSEQEGWLPCNLAIVSELDDMHSVGVTLLLDKRGVQHSGTSHCAAFLLSADDATKLANNLERVASKIRESVQRIESIPAQIQVDKQALELTFRKMVVSHLDTFDWIIDCYDQRAADLDEKGRALLQRLRDAQQRARVELNEAKPTSDDIQKVAAAMMPLNQVFFAFHELYKAHKINLDE